MAIQTIEEFKLLGKPPGFMTIYKFCQSVSAGESVDPEILNKVCEALNVLLREGQERLQDGLMFFAESLELNDTAGRRRTAKHADEELAIAIKVLLAENSGWKRSEAKRKIAKEVHKHSDTVGRYLVEHEDVARDFIEKFNIK